MLQNVNPFRSLFGALMFTGMMLVTVAGLKSYRDLSIAQDREARLERPAKTVFVRYVGDPALNRIRIAAHCVDEAPRPSPRVELTHVWRDAGAVRRQQIVLTGPDTYSIDAGSERRVVLVSSTSTPNWFRMLKLSNATVESVRDVSGGNGPI